MAAQYASALRGLSEGPAGGRLRGVRSSADGGRVIVRHSPCTPWRLPTGLGHRSALPQDPLLPEDAAPRSPPNLPRSREERSAPLPEPISARPPGGVERGVPSRRSPHQRRQDVRMRKQASPVPPCARDMTRTTEGPGR